MLKSMRGMAGDDVFHSRSSGTSYVLALQYLARIHIHNCRRSSTFFRVAQSMCQQGFDVVYDLATAFGYATMLDGPKESKRSIATLSRTNAQVDDMLSKFESCR